MPEVLQRANRRLDARERDRAIAGSDDLPVWSVPVLRNAESIDITVTDQLMAELEDRRARGEWSRDRAVSDRWLAPRFHWAMRLYRAEAADKNLWLWLALRYPSYVSWRWSSAKDIPEDRWYGPVHKQSFSRLWWGGEIFRNGSDYRPVQRAFVRQDLPNSYLHRPVVRCRSLALGILDVIAPATRETEVSSDQVNDLARTLNLAAAGSPPEAATDFQQDDSLGYRAWVLEGPNTPTDWDALPDGPSCVDTTESSVTGGRGVAERAWVFAERAKS